MSSSNCCFFTRIQVSQETGKVIWYSHLFKNFLQFIMIHTVKGISVVSEAEVNVFMEFSCFICDWTNVGNLISDSSALSKPSLYIKKFSVHKLLKPNLEDFEYHLTSLQNECSCMILWIFFDTALLWDWNGNTDLPVLWPLLSFPNLLAYWVQHFNTIIF